MNKELSFLAMIFLWFSGSTYGQESLELQDCQHVEFVADDHTDADDDGLICENINAVLTNRATYLNGDSCDLSEILWVVQIDLDSDGAIDYEYRSDLPIDDVMFDDTDANGIPDIYIAPTSNDEDQFIVLEDLGLSVDDHSVVWTISDACGFSDDCVSTFSVIDDKAPTPFCVSLSTSVLEGSEVEIFAEDYNIGVFDICTENADIRISFSADSIVPSRILTCDDVINSPLMQIVYFWDDSDNIDFCQVFITVLPDEEGSGCYPDEEIKGNIKNREGSPMEGVKVSLNSAIPDFLEEVYTDSLGNYSFGLQSGDVEFTITASYEDSYLSGVTTLDLVLIVRHILGLASFSDPYRILASDVNADGAVKASDLLLMRKLILGIVPEFPTDASWKFIDASFEFNNPLNPFPDLMDANPNPHSIIVNLIDPEGYDFVGYKYGDVNN